MTYGLDNQDESRYVDGAKRRQQVANKVFYVTAAEDNPADVSRLKAGANFDTIQQPSKAEFDNFSFVRDCPTISGYVIVSELGRGGMGIVFRARHSILNREVAIKTIRGVDVSDSRERMRFLLEAESIAAIKHQNVVQVFEFGEADSFPYIVLELLTGGTLAKLIQSRDKLKPLEIAGLIQKVARGVGAAHDAGLVHRDLKPSNILLDETGEPKVSDFGLVKTSSRDLTRTGAVFGTPAYMSPEQCRDAKFVGPPTDVWAIGVILYECLTGSLPFKGESDWARMHSVLEDSPTTPRSIVAGLPTDLELICLKCLEKAATDRYPTAQELADDLKRFADGLPVSVRKTGSVERLYKWARRRPMVALAALLASVTLLLLLFGSVVSWLWRDAVEARIELKEAWSEADKNRLRADKIEYAQRQERADLAAERLLFRIPEFKRKGMWKEAIDSIEDSLASAAPDLGQDVTNRLRLAEQNVKLLADLDAIRMKKAGLAAEHPDEVWSDKEIEMEYEQTFRRTDLSRIGSSTIKQELIEAADDWAWQCRDRTAQAIWESIAVQENQPWRGNLIVAAFSPPDALILSQSVPRQELTSSTIIGLGRSMRMLSNKKSRIAAEWLEEGAQADPSDFWISFYLGVEYMRLEEWAAAAGAYRAALAVRPESPLARQWLEHCISKQLPGNDEASLPDSMN